MRVFLILACVATLASPLPSQEVPTRRAPMWPKIQALVEEGTPYGNAKLLEYLQSLTREELLGTVREACAAGLNRLGLTLEWERAAAAESNALLCLEGYYYGESNNGEGRTERLTVATDRLAGIAADNRETVCFRSIVIASVGYTRGSRFRETLMTHSDAHFARWETVLNEISRNREEDPRLRKEAVSAIGRMTGERIRAIYRLDPNVREMRKHTDQVLNVGVLVRSGELILAPETVRALEPYGRRIKAHVRILEGILAEGKDGLETLQAHAQRLLESHQRSSFVRLDTDRDETRR